MDNSSQMGW